MGDVLRARLEGGEGWPVGEALRLVGDRAENPLPPPPATGLRMGERALLLLGDRLPPGDGGDLEGERSERWALDFLLRGIEYMTPHRTRAHVQAGVRTAPRVCCASRLAAPGERAHERSVSEPNPLLSQSWEKFPRCLLRLWHRGEKKGAVETGPTPAEAAMRRGGQPCRLAEAAAQVGSSSGGRQRHQPQRKPESPRLQLHRPGPGGMRVAAPHPPTRHSPDSDSAQT